MGHFVISMSGAGALRTWCSVHGKEALKLGCEEWGRVKGDLEVQRHKIEPRK